MSGDLTLKQMQKAWHGSLKSYIIGFVISLLLTSISFYLVIAKPLSVPNVIYAISTLAITQATFQLLYFLHLSKEEKPRWETYSFLLMLLILLIIVCGTLWVMHDLNIRTMNMEMMTHD